MSTTSITGAYLEELTGFEPVITVLQTISLTNLDTTPPERWLGRLDSNQSVQESKSCALPAWLRPNKNGGLSWN